MAYCYMELAIYFPSSGRGHCQQSFHLPMEGWPLGLDDSFNTRMVQK